MKKTNIWMSLLIGDVLKDIQRLENEEVGILLRWWIDHWLHGSLPSEMERVMRVGNVAPSEHARSIAQALLKHHFKQRPDGSWIAEREAEEKARADRNSLVNHARAKKAADARWKKHREEKAKGMLEGMLGASLEHMPEQSPSPSPSLPSSQARKEKKRGSRRSPRGGEEAAKSETGAGQRTKTGARAMAAATHRNNVALGPKPVNVLSVAVERRIKWLHDEVKKFWGGQTGRPPDKTPLSDRDELAIAKTAGDTIGMSEEELLRCFEHRNLSVVLGWLPASLQPSKWLRDLPSFLSGPLDKDGQLVPTVRGEYRRKGER